MSRGALAVGFAAAAAAAAARPRSRLRQVTGRAAAAGPAWTPGRVVAAATLGAGFLAGPAAAALVLVGAVGRRQSTRSRQRTARSRSERARLLDALALLAAELRFGRSPADALSGAAGLAVGPSRRALVAAATSARLGGDVCEALRVDDSAAAPTLRALAACWQVCGEAGGGLAAGVERLEAGLRAAEEHRRRVDAELAAPRATAGLLVILPVGGIGLAAALGAQPVHVLLHTGPGLACLSAGLLLNGLGYAWTRWLVAGAVGETPARSAERRDSTGAARAAGWPTRRPVVRSPPARGR